MSPLAVLSLSSWAGLLLVSTLLAGLIVLADIVQQSHKHRTILEEFLNRLIESTLLFTGFSIVLHSNRYLKRLNFLKITLGFWAMASAIMAGLYSGAILVKIMESKTSLPFHDIASLSKCIEDMRCKLYTPSKNANYQRIVKAMDLSAEEMLLHNATLKNPIGIVRAVSASSIVLNDTDGLFNVYLTTKIYTDIMKVCKVKAGFILKLNSLCKPDLQCFRT